MTDTDPHTEAIYRELLLARTPEERFRMGLRMCEAARATVMASSFAAALELVREGTLDLSQKEAFAPLYFRKHIAQPVQVGPEVPAE